MKTPVLKYVTQSLFLSIFVSFFLKEVSKLAEQRVTKLLSFQDVPLFVCFALWWISDKCYVIYAHNIVLKCSYKHVLSLLCKRANVPDVYMKCIMCRQNPLFFKRCGLFLWTPIKKVNWTSMLNIFCNVLCHIYAFQKHTGTILHSLWTHDSWHVCTWGGAACSLWWGC